MLLHLRFYFFIFTLLIGSIQMADADKKTLINAQTHTLENGLKIIIVPNGLAPVVTIGVIYHVGTADDPLDQVGLSHFLEHMMFKGTKEIPGSEFNKLIIRNGGHNNAYTEYDHTFYHTTISAKHLELILKCEADRMRNLTFTQEEVTSEIDVVLEERRMRLDNNPYGIASERFLRAMHPYHPYGVHPIGLPHHIKKYTFKSARDHYDSYYRPNNATLMIGGKVTLKEALPLIEKYFGGIKSAPIPARNRPQNPPREGLTEKITQYNKRNSIIQLQLSYDAPHFHSEFGRKHYYPLLVLAYLLGGNSTAEFYHDLVERKKLAIHVSCDYDGSSIDPKDFSISAAMQPSDNIETLKAEINKLLIQIQKNGVSKDDLARAKIDMIGKLAYLKDGTENFLTTIASYVAKGFVIDDLNNWCQRIETVTIDDIKAAANVIFKNSPVVTLEIYPESKEITTESAAAA
ncbi:MAG: pitrilysin family protein [Pseudomonadota bacterium]